MPELPEVQALADHLTRHAVGRLVARVDLAAISALKTYDPPLDEVEGRRLEAVRRRGKFLVLDLGEDPDPLRLVVHLARAGWLQWREQVPSAPPRPGKGPLAVRVAFVTPEGEAAGGFDLTEAGTQKKLAAYVVRDELDVPGVARLGPEPLDDRLAPALDEQQWADLLAGVGGRQLKGVLRDQSVVAGIGNAYSDDVLHAARLSPFRAADKLTPAEVARLRDAVTEVLGEAVRRAEGQGTGTLKAEKKAGMRVHGRTGLPCPVCGDTVREVSFADSSLQYCPTCQTEGKPLADRRMSRLLR